MLSFIPPNYYTKRAVPYTERDGPTSEYVVLVCAGDVMRGRVYLTLVSGYKYWFKGYTRQRVE